MVKANNLHGLVKHECVVQWYRLGCRLSVGLVQILLKSFANVLLKKAKIWLKSIIQMILSSMIVCCSSADLVVNYPLVWSKSC